MKLQGHGNSSRMPCESCAVQFSVFRRKRACSECERYYCAGCLRRGGGTMCAPCRVLSTRPLSKLAIAHLKVRDLQSFLQRQNVSTRGCVEKEELVNLCVLHVNSAQYRRRGPRPTTFSTLKGFTNNINEFITSAFELRTSQSPSQRPTSANANCYNSSHMHTQEPRGAPAPAPAPAPVPSAHEHHPHRAHPPDRFTTTPGGEADIVVPVPGHAAGGAAHGGESSPSAAGGPRVDTADCFEVEDLDEAGWEFITRPADPLPNDSELLMSDMDAIPQVHVEAEAARVADGEAAGVGAQDGEGEDLPASPRRAASALELRSPEPPPSDPDSASLQDEPLMGPHTIEEPRNPKKILLDDVKSWSEVDALSVRQLKELLARNRVEYRGCLERAELLQRARALWDDHARHRDEIDSLPIEECCKICMSAPLECVLLECGHIATCTRCAAQLAECPICRQYVVRAVRCFRS